MVSIADANQENPEQRALGEIERPLSIFYCKAERLRFALRSRDIPQIYDRDMNFVWRTDHLNRLAVHNAEVGSPRFMSANHFGERTLQNCRVERACFINRNGFVVERDFGDQLAVQPDLFLAVRKGNDVASRTTADSGLRLRPLITQVCDLDAHRY